MSRLVAWTDGGCRGNPGIGAWAFLIVDTQTGTALERADGDAQTTNNRMEMMGAIACMRSLRKPGSELLIRSDSRYLIDCCSKWMPGWKRAGWKRKAGPLKNLDLLQELDRLLAQHRIRWEWVKGHAGDAGNEHVDALLNSAMDRLAAGQSAAHESRLTWPG
ncbi:MAG: ribonuclease H family protein [Planctomycetota bacterium]